VPYESTGWRNSGALNQNSAVVSFPRVRLFALSQVWWHDSRWTSGHPVGPCSPSW